MIYGAILLSGVGALLVGSLAVRMPFKVDVVRDRATLAREVEDGVIENIYRLQIMNAAESPFSTSRWKSEDIDGLRMSQPRRSAHAGARRGAMGHGVPAPAAAPTRDAWAAVRIRCTSPSGP